jgi:hypothetical protein
LNAHGALRGKFTAPFEGLGITGGLAANKITIMCQLLGMNCNTPTDICFSFAGFQARGGLTDVHGDGWGIAFFEGRGVRVFLDPKASSPRRWPSWCAITRSIRSTSSPISARPPRASSP